MAAKIAKVEVARYDYLFRGSFKFFPPGPDGKSRRASVLVRITDEEGLQGIGQAVPIPTWTYETPETVVSTLRGYLAPALIGADPGDPEEIHQRLNQAIRPAFSVGQPICKAAIDLACFDLIGKRRGISVKELLAQLAPSTAPTAGRSEITLSWTINSPDMAVVEQQLEEGRRLGFRNFNIKVGAPQTLRVRSGVGPQGARLRPRRFSLGRRQHRLHGGGGARGRAQTGRRRRRRPGVALAAQPDPGLSSSEKARRPAHPDGRRDPLCRSRLRSLSSWG